MIKTNRILSWHHSIFLKLERLKIYEIVKKCLAWKTMRRSGLIRFYDCAFFLSNDESLLLKMPDCLLLLWNKSSNWNRFLSCIVHIITIMTCLSQMSSKLIAYQIENLPLWNRITVIFYVQLRYSLSAW